MEMFGEEKFLYKFVIPFIFKILIPCIFSVITSLGTCYLLNNYLLKK